jgi:hypothetical protein
VGKEGEVLKDFTVQFTKMGSRVFRINSGMAWIGNTIHLRVPQKEPLIS